MKFEVTSSSMKAELLNHLIYRMDGGELDDLLRGTADPTVLDNLRDRPARDLIKLINGSSGLKFHIEFCSTKFINELNRMDMMTSNTMIREYFVAHGAPMEMVTEMFRVTPAQVRDWRNMLMPGYEAKKLGGRTRMLPEKLRDVLHQKWAALEKNSTLSLQDRVYAMHQEYPSYTIHELWITLNEFTPKEKQRFSQF
jgi:hypothetical protein